MTELGGRAVEWLRGLVLSLERLATEGVAGGAVRGAAGELHAGLPKELEEHARALLRDGLVLLERMVHDAAVSGVAPPGNWTRAAAEGAVRGTLEELRRLIPDIEPTTQNLLTRIQSLLEGSAHEHEERAEGLRLPGDRARLAAAGAVAGAMEQLGANLPLLEAPARDVASGVGTGIVRGASEELRRQLRGAGRSPLVWAVVAAGAIVSLSVSLSVLLAARRG